MKGEGNQQDYGMRVYDPRIGRFLSVDPLTKNFTDLAPYQFSGNTPTDLDGAETYLQRHQTALRNNVKIKVAIADKVIADAQQAELNRWKPKEMEVWLNDPYMKLLR
ncbi:hypothetical protein DVR12_17660 [Chitinophaga silvatica]|uniref:RHS repeat-associated core domain-containing protein n=1 Tax=Chitinophaga silvatica TaxID=2282649 RepID=A0A3E1Y7Y8_9BACT|nr:hypothetical protein DVR12_17660 [Chitinophaga silvatica]